MKDIDIVNLVIMILATWRLTSLLHSELGPFDLFVHIRKMFGILHDDLGYPFGYPPNFFAKLFECFWCLSVWIGIGVTVSVYLFPIAIWLWLALALSGGAIKLNEVIK